MLLFLHGYGERGDDLERVKALGPPKLIAEGKDFPFVVVSPQDPRGWWEPTELTVLLDEVVNEFKIDQSRRIAYLPKGSSDGSTADGGSSS